MAPPTAAPTAPPSTRSTPSDRTTLLSAFLAWKALLFSIALGTALTPSYDTSTSLALGLPLTLDHPAPSLVPAVGSSSLADVLASRLTRWDAIYFSTSAHRGYVFEQEWAFVAGLPLLVSRVLVPCLSVLGVSSPPSVRTASLVSIAVSNVSHLLAVLLLHALVRRLLPNGSRNLALVAGLLHVVSPAGLFLSAPYAESLFACLSFAGYLAYASRSLPRAASLVLSGALFGLATLCRSNGILNGIIFVVELLASLQGFLRAPGFRPLLTLVPPIVGGVLVGLGSLAPQGAAYLRYCATSGPTRPWCEKLVPSIYTFVQEYYWNCGFLRYWTLSNLPLFLLATPMLAILITSAYAVARRTLPPSAWNLSSTTPGARPLLSMALGQGLLAVLALTSYHVQIITRLASAYPAWYLWVASALCGAAGAGKGDALAMGPTMGGGLARAVVMYMVLYAGVQGVLFASFLPPA